MSASSQSAGSRDSRGSVNKPQEASSAAGRRERALQRSYTAEQDPKSADSQRSRRSSSRALGTAAEKGAGREKEGKEGPATSKLLGKGHGSGAATSAVSQA